MSQIPFHITVLNPSVTTELSLKQLLIDGTGYNIALVTLILGTLRINPEIWVNDYPPDIKEKYGPMLTASRPWATLAEVWQQ